MEIILIIFFLVIIVCMGYILSKPLLKDKDDQGDTNNEAYLEIKYKMLLLEIKRTLKQCEARKIPKDQCRAQIHRLKKEAVNLVRELNLDPTELQKLIPNENLFDPSSEDLGTAYNGYCPQCGEHIEVNDKFCLHCGQTLKP